jgi:phosphonate transport system substrate-binding protein
MSRAAVWLWMVAGTAWAAPPGPVQQVVVSQRVLYRVNPTDARAAIEVWGRQIGAYRGFPCDARVEISPNLDYIRQRLQAGTVDVMVLDAPEYLLLADAARLEPVFTASTGGRATMRQYLLVVSGRAPVPALSALRGSRVAVYSRTGSQVGLVWLEALLADRKLGRAQGFFSEVLSVEKPSQCVLPLFFGKIAACVLDLDALELSREMNPQMNRLRELARSAPLLEKVIAVPRPPRPYRDNVLAAIRDSALVQAGAQMQLLFRTGPPLPVAPAMFDAVETLFHNYRRIAGRPLPPLEAAPAGF